MAIELRSVSRDLSLIWLLLTTTLMSASASVAEAETILCGDITTNTTLTAAASPYRVTCELLVRNGATLTVEPGVALRFDSGTRLAVGNPTTWSDTGSLVAVGTSALPITFTSSSGTTNGWEGLIFPDASNESGAASQLEWCVIENAGQLTEFGTQANISTKTTSAPALSHCTVRGATGNGMYVGACDSGSCAALTISNTNFEDNTETDLLCADGVAPTLVGCAFASGDDLGLDVTNSAAGSPLSACSFYGTGELAFKVPPAMAQSGGFTLSGYTTGVGIYAGNVGVGGSGNRTWSDLGGVLAYRILGDVAVVKGATLTIDPGTLLKFDSGTRLSAGNPNNYNDPGSLIAIGNSDQPITFTSSSGATNGWEGLIFPDASNESGASSQLTWCVVEYAGQLNELETRANISTKTTSTPAMHRCTVRGSAGFGMDVGRCDLGRCEALVITNTVFTENNEADVNCSSYKGVVPSFSACAFVSGDDPGIDAGSALPGEPLAACQFIGTADLAFKLPPSMIDDGGFTLSGYATGVGVYTGAISGGVSGDRTWPDLPGGKVYRVLGDVTVAGGSTLTIEAGAMLKFDSGTQLAIGNPSNYYDAGSLVAMGSFSNMIWFTSATGATNGWKGLYFTDASNELGASSSLAWCVIEKAGQPNQVGEQANITCRWTTAPNMDSCIVRGATGFGLVCAHQGPTLFECSIVDNSLGGVSCSADLVNAANCWWQAASGPYDPSTGPPSHNPLGEGQYVTDLVAYEPYLAEAPHKYAIDGTSFDGGGIIPIVPPAPGLPSSLSVVTPRAEPTLDSLQVLVSIGLDQGFQVVPDACHHVVDVVVDGVSVGPVSTYTFSNVQAGHAIAATFAVDVHSMAASASGGGTIDPSGGEVVTCGDDRTYTMTPDPCHHVADVLVDGASVGPLTSYTFDDIAADHTIEVSFATDGPYEIVAAAGANGSITPSGTVSAPCGSNSVFFVAPAPHHAIQDVLVDGVSVGPLPEYTFTDVTANHTIAASFAVETFTLLRSADGGGTIVAAPDAPNYAWGTEVTLTPSPFAGWLFDHWSGDASGSSSPLVVIMDANKSITAVFIDAAAPDVAVTRPNGGETWASGQSEAITWTATDNAGVTTVDVSYSVDGGATFPYAIATGISNTGTYAWLVPTLETNSAKVRIVAHDAAGNSALDMSDAVFAIHDPTSGVAEMLLGPDRSMTVLPNPATSAEMNVIYRSDGGAVEVSIFDATGRRVRTLERGSVPVGVRQIPWDGRTADGSPVASGVYVVLVARESNRSARQRVVVIR